MGYNYVRLSVRLSKFLVSAASPKWMHLGLLITDGEGEKIDDPTNFSKSVITNGSAVTLTLKPHGGFVAKF